MYDPKNHHQCKGMATLVDISDDPTVGRIKQAIQAIADDEEVAGTQKYHAIQLLEEALKIIRPA